jgi:type VI secretion system secreted protein VgrG
MGVQSRREAINELFCFDIDALSTSTDLDLSLFIGVIIFDSRVSAPETPGGDTIRFHGVRATERDDAIDEIRARRQVAANTVSISSWDPTQLVAPASEQESILDAGDVPSLPNYDGSGERIFADRHAAHQRSDLMLLALELNNKIFEGAGAVRQLAAGHAFRLMQHERYPEGENAFTVLWVRHSRHSNRTCRRIV